MDWIINNLFGLGKLWAWADGKKTYIAAGATMLTALAALLAALAGLVNEALPLLAAHDVTGLLHFVRAIPQDPNGAALLKAWLLFHAGLGVMGIGHKLDKAADASSGPAVIVNQHPDASAPAVTVNAAPGDLTKQA